MKYYEKCQEIQSIKIPKAWAFDYDDKLNIKIYQKYLWKNNIKLG